MFGLETIQGQRQDLMRRLASRDEMLHKVTVEATKLKEKYRHSSAQVCDVISSSR